MRSALEEAWTARARPTAAPADVAPAPAEVFFSTSAFGFSTAEPMRVAQATPPPTLGEGALSIEAFRACVDSSPNEACRHFLRQLGDRLAQPGAFEMGVTLINGIIFNPAQAWVASNTPLSVMRMVCRSRALGEHVRITALAPTVDARARAEQRGITVHLLDDMLFALAQMGECRLPH